MTENHRSIIASEFASLCDQAARRRALPDIRISIAGDAERPRPAGGVFVVAGPTEAGLSTSLVPAFQTLWASQRGMSK
jgi:hypothetical protein